MAVIIAILKNRGNHENIQTYYIFLCDRGGKRLLTIMEQVILFFDQSTNITGFSVWEAKTLLEYGLIDLHKNKDTEERFKQMMIEIDRVVEKYHPSLLVMEEVAQQSNVSVLKILARL